jgi:hemoglobin
MELTISNFTVGTKPDVPIPDKVLYSLLKEDGMRKMISDHYDLLSKSSISELFAKDAQGLEQAKKNSSDFFIQFYGGPNYFNENRGKPMLVGRHMAFTITPEARVVWLECFREVLLKLEIDEKPIIEFWNYLNYFSFWMVNSHLIAHVDESTKGETNSNPSR